MSTFDNPEYQWRETYLLFLGASNRPTTAAVAAAVAELGQKFELRDLRGNEDGLFDFVTIISPDAYAAIDIGFTEGEEVDEQFDELIENLQATVDGEEEKEKLARLRKMNARIDFLHFEQIVSPGEMEEGEEPEDVLDPSALLLVVEQLAELCDGVAVDPQSDSLM